VPILLPDLGTPAATFSLWHIGAGERVTQGERLAEVLIPGVAVELLATATGVLCEVIARPGDRLTNDQPLGFINAE
jgi:2-oxoglutarate dehydrogenase E2 component (dihydrolipoamide succinyltransferase)/2-oxoisovalerate dehydrogenase E2 component (dihydrolipoyl transacylase)